MDPFPFTQLSLQATATLLIEQHPCNLLHVIAQIAGILWRFKVSVNDFVMMQI